MTTRTLIDSITKTILTTLVFSVGIALFTALLPETLDGLIARAELNNAGVTSSEKSGALNLKYKSLHIMSYHSPWEWTDDLFRGFKDELTDLN